MKKCEENLILEILRRVDKVSNISKKDALTFLGRQVKLMPEMQGNAVFIEWTVKNYKKYIN